MGSSFTIYFCYFFLFAFCVLLSVCIPMCGVNSFLHLELLHSKLYCVQNRVDYQHRFTLEDIQKYLSKHMVLHESHLLTLPVSEHFDINTSVLVVTSQRAGMGMRIL